MSEVLLMRTFEVRGRDFDKAGETSSEIKALLKEVGIDPAVIRRAGVVTFEAEMNVVMYAETATVVFTLSDEDITIEVFDRGPGIADISLAMQEGYSTATDEMRQMGFGFGMGLPNIKKNSDAFTLESEVGKGTRVHSVIKLDDNR
ncbi:MAG: anti-sigma regulatory factor [Candidatus Aminicenantes bacterium RBG_13_63_10]|nr:MAG: anti-sigma regulatory factor [Candidatus Aminicenantes bacterium RBG_13_63_10]